MSYVALSFVPNRGLYDVVAKHLDIAGDRPAGLVLHAAGELPDGRVQLVDVWQSMDDMHAFEQQRLFAAFDAAGVPEEVRANGRPTVCESFEILR
jgi:hypothetical protein